MKDDWREGRKKGVKKDRTEGRRLCVRKEGRKEGRKERTKKRGKDGQNHEGREEGPKKQRRWSDNSFLFVFVLPFFLVIAFLAHLSFGLAYFPSPPWKEDSRKDEEEG